VEIFKSRLITAWVEEAKKHGDRSGQDPHR
jgi:hypothetical protein